MGSFGQDVTGLAMALVGVAFAALLVGHASGTSQIIGASTSGFNSLLQTVSLQSSGGIGGGSLSLQMPGGMG